ncbi:MAG: Flp family type IVb pilin [Thermodesulfobacteriota bacterium]
MNLMRRVLARGFWEDTEATVVTEYALLIGLIALGIFGAVTLFGINVGKLYANAVEKLPF